MKRPAAAVKPNASCQSDEEDRGSEHGSNTGTVRYEEPEPAAAAEATKQKRATKSKQGKAKPSRDKRKNEEEEEEPAVAGKRKKKDAKPCEPPASAGETATENPATSKTFARRYCPKGGPNKEKWIGLRDAYHAAVSNQIVSPSKMEEHGFGIGLMVSSALCVEVLRSLNYQLMLLSTRTTSSSSSPPGTPRKA